MKDKILALARGEFEFEPVKLQLSKKELRLVVVSDREVSDTFTISNVCGTKVKGFITAKEQVTVEPQTFLGEETEINKRYLTASRSPWYSIENRPPAPIWVSVFNRSGLRFIRNEANIYNLTTFHCVYPKNSGVDVEVLFAYLITDVAKEIFLDNSRQYGNGLVKFEPNDLNKGMVMDLTLLSTEENTFVKNVYAFIKDTHKEKDGIELLNDFFSLRYTDGISTIEVFNERLQALKETSLSITEESVKMTSKACVKQLNLLDHFD